MILRVCYLPSDDGHVGVVECTAAVRQAFFLAFMVVLEYCNMTPHPKPHASPAIRSTTAGSRFTPDLICMLPASRIRVLSEDGLHRVLFFLMNAPTVPNETASVLRTWT